MERGGGTSRLSCLSYGPVSGRGFDVVEVGFFYEGFDDSFDDGFDDEAGGGFHEGVEEGGHFEGGGEIKSVFVAKMAGALDGEADALVFALGRMAHFQNGDEIAYTHLRDAAIARDDANAIQAIIEESARTKRNMAISKGGVDEARYLLICLHGMNLLQRCSL